MAGKRENYSGAMDPEVLARARARASQECVPFSRWLEWAVRDVLENTRPRERIKKQRPQPQPEEAPAAPPVVPRLVYRDELRKEPDDAA